MNHDRHLWIMFVRYTKILKLGHPTLLLSNSRYKLEGVEQKCLDNLSTYPANLWAWGIRSTRVDNRAGGSFENLGGRALLEGHLYRTGITSKFSKILGVQS